MSLKEKTIEELENKIERIERVIAKKGIGSDYLSKAEKIQRNLNLALFFGGITLVTGLTAWALLSSNDE